MNAEQLEKTYKQMGRPNLRKFAEEVGISYEMAKYYSAKNNWQVQDKLDLGKIQHDVCRTLIENFQRDVKEGKISLTEVNMERFKEIAMAYEVAYKAITNSNKR